MYVLFLPVNSYLLKKRQNDRLTILGISTQGYVYRKIAEFLEEDIGFTDITTDAIIEPETNAEANVVCREEGVVSGIDESIVVFTLTGCSAKAMVKEGEQVEKGKIILNITGRANSILKGERTALNILGRMSGIATETRRILVETNKVNPSIKIAATRKTIPGFRFFDKKAVQTGGGDTHRLGLDDAILIKDNHIELVGSITKAIEKARKNASFTKKIEVEVSSTRNAIEAAKAGVDIIMLDNMSPKEISNTVNELKHNNLRDKIILEASGGIKMENIVSYSKSGVDVISLGYITNSVKSIDFSLDIKSGESI